MKDYIPWFGYVVASTWQGDHAATHVEDKGEGEDENRHDGEDECKDEVPDFLVLIPHSGAQVDASQPEEEDQGGVEHLQKTRSTPVRRRHQILHHHRGSLFKGFYLWIL